MQFIITAYDGIDEKALERRMRVRPDHLANIKKVKETGSVICAGGLLNEEGKPKGSYLIMEFPTKADFDNYLEHEPYVIHQVWQEIKVEICNVVVMQDEMM